MVREKRRGTAEDDFKKEAAPRLPAAFYLELMEMPSCKTIGECDGCGSCIGEKIPHEFNLSG